MKLQVESYEEQLKIWPRSGCEILAQYDEDTVIVYQAFNRSIAEYAIANQRFGGDDFDLNRMTWVKTNFLWMMYRSGWAVKKNQERILAIRIYLSAFEKFIKEGAYTSVDCYSSRSTFQSKLQQTGIRLQWDPDHKPNGDKDMRRAIQIGISRDFVNFYNDSIIEIEDITSFVRDQRKIKDTGDYSTLLTPKERVFPFPPCDNHPSSFLPRVLIRKNNNDNNDNNIDDIKNINQQEE